MPQTNTLKSIYLTPLLLILTNNEESLNETEINQTTNEIKRVAESNNADSIPTGLPPAYHLRI